MASFTDDPAQLLAAYQAANANNPYADPFLFQNNDGSGYWTNALPTNLPYLSDNTPGSLQLTPQQIGFRDVEGNSMQAVQQGMSQAGMSTWDRLKQAIFPGRGMTRQQVELDSLAPEDKAKLESMWMSGQLTESKPWEAPNSYILRALGEEGAAKYGITPQSVKYDNIDSAQAHEWRKDNDMHDAAALNKQALISIGSILAGGLMFGGETAGAAAGAGESGAGAAAGEAGSIGAGEAAAGAGAAEAGGTMYGLQGGGTAVSGLGTGTSAGGLSLGTSAAGTEAGTLFGTSGWGAAGAGAAAGGASSGASGATAAGASGTSAGTSAGSSGLLSDGTVKAGTAVLGGLLGGTNGSKQAGTTTTTTAPWASQQPYLLDVFKQAKAASQGSPLTQKANENYASVLAGPTVNPMLGLNNPYLQQSIDYANQDVSRAMLPAMTSANRASGSYGNSGVADIYSKGLLDAYSRNATTARMQDYTQQQNLQQQAVNNTLNYTQNANQWNAQPSQLYGQTVQGSYGSTSSTPYYENKYANILGGISTGLGLYNAYKGSQ